MTDARAVALEPEDITRLIVERVNAGDRRLRVGDIALTATRASDEAAARAQVVRRQPGGIWLRILDRPDFRA